MITRDQKLTSNVGDSFRESRSVKRWAATAASPTPRPSCPAVTDGRGSVKTRPTRTFRGHRTQPATPIIDPGQLWKVDSARDCAKLETSHTLDRKGIFDLAVESRHRSAMAGVSRNVSFFGRSQAGHLEWKVTSAHLARLPQGREARLARVIVERHTAEPPSRHLTLQDIEMLLRQNA